MTLISIRRPKLQLRAVKSYRVPRYPKAGERLDFDLGDTHTWPFAPALTSALLASTLVASSGRVAYAGEGEGTTAVAASPATESEAVPNPFGPEQRSIDFGGKGGPMTMPKEMALVAIARGFEKSGLRFKSNVLYKEAAVDAELDGYDRSRAVGFEWIGQHDYGEGDKRIDNAEAVRLDKDAAAGKRQIAMIHANDRRFTGDPGEAAKRLTLAVQQYVDHLRSVGAL